MPSHFIFLHTCPNEYLLREKENYIGKKNCFAHCWGPSLSWETVLVFPQTTASNWHLHSVCGVSCITKSNCWLSPQKEIRKTFLRTWLVKFSTLFERFAIMGYLKWTPNNRAVQQMTAPSVIQLLQIQLSV